MNPLDYTGEDLGKLKNKLISIRYQFEPNKYVWIGGIIREIYLTANPPNLPGSIDFQVSQKSKEILVQNKIKIPENIGIFDIEAIDETPYN